MCVAVQGNDEDMNYCCKLPLANGDSYVGSVGGLNRKFNVPSGTRRSVPWVVENHFIMNFPIVTLPSTAGKRYFLQIYMGETFDNGISIYSQAMPTMMGSSYFDVGQSLQAAHPFDIPVDDERMQTVSMQFLNFKTGPNVYEVEVTDLLKEIAKTRSVGELLPLRIGSNDNVCPGRTCNKTIGYTIKLVYLREQPEQEPADLSAEAIVGITVGSFVAFTLLVLAGIHFKNRTA